jgi:hypothetical protein
MIHQAPQAERFKQQLRESLQRETLNSRAVKIAKRLWTRLMRWSRVDARPINAPEAIDDQPWWPGRTEAEMMVEDLMIRGKGRVP